MTMRKAVYAASLDPITYGHINIAERMAPLYDTLVVVVAVDSRKTYTCSPEERVDMAKAALAHLPNVTVEVCLGHYVVKHAEAIGAQVIIRGLRNYNDLEYEQALAEENRKICPHIETILVSCLPHLMHVSSSMVKGHVGIDPTWEEQVARSVPPPVVAKLKEKYILGRARKHWASLMASLGNPKHADEVLADLLLRYSEPHRAYHTLLHIVNTLDEFAQLEHGGKNANAVILATWFHDAIYDTTAKGSEEASAELAKTAMRKLGLLLKMGKEVERLILATMHAAAPTDADAQMLVDVDLAILGKSEKEFDAYEVDIRKEYAWVPEAEFRSRRAEILQGFLDRPTIFSTDILRTKYEQSARKNLERSIRQLKK